MISDEWTWSQVEGSRAFAMVASILLVAALSWYARALANIRPLEFPQGGIARKRRLKSVRTSTLRFWDLPLRYLGAVVQVCLARLSKIHQKIAWAVHQLDARQRRLLIWAGHPLGLLSEEMMALSLMSGSVLAALGWLQGEEAGTLLWALSGAVLGVALPTLRLRALAKERFLEMRRELPAAIDLTALAMSAGCDFPTALAHVIRGQRGVVAEEFRQVLLALELGTTRKSALQALEQRVPVDEVSDLVRAVILAEEKGSTVAEALSQQAQSSRQRRSVLAEEAAARAGTMLLVPIMLLVGCIALMLVGPLLIQSSALG